MLLTFSLPDDVYAKYVAHNPQNPSRAVVKQLERFQDVSPSERVVLLGKKDLAEAQRLLEGVVEDVPSLVARLRAVASIKVDGVSVELTEAQRLLVVERATFMGQLPADWLLDQLKEIIAARLS